MGWVLQNTLAALEYVSEGIAGSCLSWMFILLVRDYNVPLLTLEAEDSNELILESAVMDRIVVPMTTAFSTLRLNA